MLTSTTTKSGRDETLFEQSGYHHEAAVQPKYGKDDGRKPRRHASGDLRAFVIIFHAEGFTLVSDPTRQQIEYYAPTAQNHEAAEDSRSQSHVATAAQACSTYRH